MTKGLYDAVKDTFLTMGSRMVDTQLLASKYKRQSLIDYHECNAHAIYEEFSEWFDAGKNGIEYNVTHHEYFGKDEIKRINQIIKERDNNSRKSK
jgi:hypothetical protein